MMKNMLLITALTIVGSAFSQSGYSYTPQQGYIKINYTRTFIEKPDTFITEYKLRNVYNQNHLFTVTATHYKSLKKVVVYVEQVGAGIFGIKHSEETIYETPSLEMFGFAGAYKAMAGNSVPNQLAVKFVSASFENVRVVDVLAEVGGNPLFFSLEKN